MDADDAARRAVETLGDTVRRLVMTLTETRVSAGELAEADELCRRAEALLARDARRPLEPSPYDGSGPGERPFTLGRGVANPLSPPLAYAWDDDAVRVAFTLGRAHEGPPGAAHGGVSALVLDDLLARVPQLLGVPRVTRGLDIRYRRPVPLGAPLVAVATVTGQAGVEVDVAGWIARAEEPDVRLAEATATFVRLRDDQVRRLIPDWTPSSEWPD
ncbi:PaaI family thioesterase [Microbacterium sp. No. 7]|uniref:PaaI family thioesterase n=1 Tax=Microbacterium sp. No. 7 TaxID=1714373 RepID=UPI0006D0A371|nr:PaaI family thioesterase [Microbacterium sp. No. 7]ALJ19240.1 hypothetical protein AOA12_04720 [Microbacterium sp. No. 7]